MKIFFLCQCFTFLLLTLTTVQVSAQSPTVKWEKTFGSNKSDEVFHGAIQDAEGDIILVGEYRENAATKRKALFMIVNTIGEMLSVRTYGAQNDLTAYCLTQGPDNTYYLGGQTGNQGWIAQLDRNGELLWQTTTTPEENEGEVRALFYDAEQQLLYWAGALGQEGIIAAYNREGTQISQFPLTYKKPLRIIKMRPSPEHGLILLGENQKGERYRCFTYVGRFNRATKTLQQEPKVYESVQPSDILLDRNQKSYWLTGTDWTVQNGDMMVSQLDEAGNILIRETFGGRNEDSGNAIIQTPDNQLYTIGTGLSYLPSGTKRPRIWLNHISDEGKALWEEPVYFGMNNRYNRGVGILQLNNGDILGIGIFPGRNGKDNGWLICVSGPAVDTQFSSAELSIMDFSILGGNGDEVINAGEEVFLYGMVKNIGTSSVAGLVARLSNEEGNDQLAVKEKEEIGVLNPGEQKEIAFRINASENLLDGRAVFTLTVQDQTGLELTEATLDLPTRAISSPELSFIGFQIEENTPSGQIKRGVPFTLFLSFENTGKTPIQHADFGIALPKGVTTDDLQYQDFPDLKPGEDDLLIFNLIADADYPEASMLIRINVHNKYSSIDLRETIRIDLEPLPLPARSSEEIRLFWLTPRKQSIEVAEDQYLLTWVAFTLDTIDINDYEIWIKAGGAISSATLEEGIKYEKVPLRKRRKQNDEQEFEVEINLVEGWNEIWVELKKDGLKSKSESRFIHYSPKPDLFLLAIGVPFDNLQYTTRDAEDITNSFMGQKGKLYDEVHIELLNTKEKTKILPLSKAINRLKTKYSLGEITKKDVVVLYISSHGRNLGRRSGDKQFRIEASDTDEGFLEATTLNFEADILQIFEDIECKKQIYIDACRRENIYASSSGTRGITSDDAAAAVYHLAQADERSHSLLSCDRGEVSYEDKKWGNGAFTEALLEAFQNKEVAIDGLPIQPDDNEDGYLTLLEVAHFVQKRVPQLVQSVFKDGNQHPVLLPNEVGSDLKFFKLNP